MTLFLPSTPKILLAASRSTYSAALTAQLQEWNYPVRFVQDGREAVELLANEDAPRTVALIDEALEDPSGLEIAAQVKRKAPNCPPWIILLRDQTDAHAVTLAMTAGVDDIFVKSADTAALKVRLVIAERMLSLASQLDAQASAVRFHATHDSLTGLWNRDSLLSMLFPETDRVQRMKTPLALLLMDLDHFSSINLEYGYEAGDRVLQELTNRFRRHLRSYDLIGRYGEDEFVVALPGCTPEQAFSLAFRMKQSILGKPFALGGDMVKITASVGIGHSLGRSPLVVLREAESALAEAKTGGRDRVIEYQDVASARPPHTPVLKLE